jgi:hypothetical protein
MSEDKIVLRVLEAYASVIPAVAGASTYLLYITAAMLGTALASTTIELLEVRDLAWAVYGLALSAAFSITTLGVVKLWRIVSILEAFKRSYSEKSGKYTLLIVWIIAFLISIPLGLVIKTSFPPYVLSASLGVALGNLLMIPFISDGKAKYGPLFVGAYLIISIVTYYCLPNLASILLIFHLTFSYQAVALWYLFEGERAAVVILHAARGGDQTNNRTQ